MDDSAELQRFFELRVPSAQCLLNRFQCFSSPARSTRHLGRLWPSDFRAPRGLVRGAPVLGVAVGGWSPVLMLVPGVAGPLTKVQEKEKMMLSEVIGKVTSECWDKCIAGAPGSKLSSGETSCLSNCAQRFLDMSEIVGKRFGAH